jgi:hypothetical protein
MLFCSGVHLCTRLVETGSGMELELGAVLCILPARELVVTISTVGFAVALVMDTYGASSKEMVSGRGNHGHPVCHGFEASSEMAEEQRGGHSRAKRRSRYCRNLMSTAVTYSEWTHAASMLHLERGRNEEAQLYDEAYVQGKLRELQVRRKQGTTDEILFFLRADLIRHLGNMCNPELHKHRAEAPAVIRDYIKEVKYVKFNTFVSFPRRTSCVLFSPRS